MITEDYSYTIYQMQPHPFLLHENLLRGEKIYKFMLLLLPNIQQLHPKNIKIASPKFD